MREYQRHKKGFGLLEILISLALIVSITWIFMKESHKKNEAMLKNLSLVTPQGSAPITTQVVTEAVENQLHEISKSHENKLQCAADDNCEKPTP